MAEGQGFEPWVPFWSTHTFQACQLNRSCNLPILDFEFAKLINLFHFKQANRILISSPGRIP